MVRTTLTLNIVCILWSQNNFLNLVFFAWCFRKRWNNKKTLKNDSNWLICNLVSYLQHEDPWCYPQRRWPLHMHWWICWGCYRRVGPHHCPVRPNLRAADLRWVLVIGTGACQPHMHRHFHPQCYWSVPNVTGEVYCFPRRQLVFSFDRRVIYHSKGLWEYIPKSILSVRLYHDLQTNSGTFFIINLWCYTYINGFVSTSSTNKWKAFFKIQIRFRINARKIFKRITRREHRSNCNVLYINGFVSTISIKLWKHFSNFRIIFE